MSQSVLQWHFIYEISLEEIQSHTAVKKLCDWSVCTDVATFALENLVCGFKLCIIHDCSNWK